MTQSQRESDFFMSFILLIASNVLSNPELKKIRSTGNAVILLRVMSLVLFFCFGAEIAPNLAIFLVVGSIIACVLSTEARLVIRRMGAI